MNLEGLMISLDQIQYYFLMFARVMTMLVFLPIFNSSNIPMQIKIAIALLLTSILFYVQLAAGLPEFPGEFSLWLFALLIFKEILIGLVIGFASSFLFAAVQFAGRLIDTEMGFGFVEVSDPTTGESVTVLGQFQTIVFTIFFLLINGHAMLLITIARSFEVLPLFEANFPGGLMTDRLILMTANIFIFGLKLAAPVFVTLMLAQLALGIVARTVPQMNIFFVGLPLKIGVGIGTMILVLPLLTMLFRTMTDMMIEDLWVFLRIMRAAT